MIILNYPMHCYTSRITMQQHAELVDESELAVHSVPLTVNVDVQAEVSRPAQKMRQKFILRTVEYSMYIHTMGDGSGRISYSTLKMSVRFCVRRFGTHVLQYCFYCTSYCTYEQ
jgi:hypothetical protein